MRAVSQLLCDSCDKVLNLEAHKIFWQLLMEKEFIGQVLKALPTSTESMSTASCSRVLTYIDLLCHLSTVCYASLHYHHVQWPMSFAL